MTGVPRLVAFSVKLPVPFKPNLDDKIDPVWLTAPPASNTTLAPVSTAPNTKPEASVKRIVPAAPVVVSLVVLPAAAVSAALRTRALSVPMSLPAVSSVMLAPLLV